MRRVMLVAVLAGLATGCGDSAPELKGKVLEDAQARDQKQAEDAEKAEFSRNTKGKKK